MDAVSYSLASKQAQRIEKFIENPDSTSGIVTVPKVIEAGENVTIPTGRVAVLPNVQVDGTLNIDGEVFIPSGATFGDLESQIAVKADTSYVNTQLDLKQNVLVANDLAVKTALNATGTAPIYACRAWVSFKGTGAVTINKGGNTSSITDNGVGDYTINFTAAMPDALYALAGSAIVDATEIADVIAIKLATASTYANKTTSGVTFRVGNNNADGAVDAFDINVFIID